MLWPDDVQVMTREFRVRTVLERGHAICPACLTVHAKAGEEHRWRRPWSLTPRCLVDGCGTALLMPLLAPRPIVA